jgi:RNA polymerase sigma factor FliA
VRGAILDYLRSLDPMTRKLRGASRRVTEAVAELSGKLARQPTAEEVAAALGLSLEQYHELLGEIGAAGLTTLEAVDFADIGAPEPSPEQHAASREQVSRLAAAIRELPERLQTLLALYYQEECTQKEIGAVMSVTESRVCQLHAEAVLRLRAALSGGPR